jgi:NADPH:quinone reductase-like Zn-dependent oxidoreductase
MGRQLRALALSPFLRQRLTMVTPRQRAADLERLTALVEAGTVTPSIGATYPLAQLPEAMRHLESGRARGKIVITI